MFVYVSVTGLKFLKNDKNNFCKINDKKNVYKINDKNNFYKINLF
jgi:hypothetical protein